jgi:hypothetical protein
MVCIALLHAMTADALACNDEYDCQQECDAAFAAMKLPQHEHDWLELNTCQEDGPAWREQLQKRLACIDEVKPTHWKPYDDMDGHFGFDGQALCYIFVDSPAMREKILACGREYQNAGVIRHDDVLERCLRGQDFINKRDDVIGCLKQEQSTFAGKPAFMDAADAECVDPTFRANVADVSHCALELAKTSFVPHTIVRACEAEGVRKDPAGYTACERQVVALDRKGSSVKQARYPCGMDQARADVKLVLQCFAELKKVKELDDPKNDKTALVLCGQPEFRDQRTTIVPCMVKKLGVVTKLRDESEIESAWHDCR